MSSLSFHKLVRQFDYDPTVPLNIQVLSQPDVAGLQFKLRKGVTLSEITYDTPGGSIKGYFIKPQSNRSLAGVLWVHQYPGTNTEFLPDAVSLAS